MSTRLKAYRRKQFEPAPEKCPDCHKKIKYHDTFARHGVAQDMSQRYGIRIMRRHIKAIGECDCKMGWVKLA